MRRITFFGIVIALAAVSLVLRAASSGANPVPEVQVVANKFAFEPAVIQVTAGEPVRLVIHSVDRVHGFSIRDLSIDVQIPRSGTSSSNSQPRARGATKSPAPNSAGAGTGT